jgi:hypothetical protein
MKMNIDDELKQLELATSRAPAQNLDAETAALREGWNVLTAALEKSSGPIDEGTLVTKLQREFTSSPPACETKRAGSGWIVVAALLGGALAASLLFVVALASGTFSKQPIAKPETPVIAPQHNLANSPSIKSAPTVENPSQQEISENDGPVWNWDDSLDSQISVAATQMQSLQNNQALPLDDSISTLNYRLQQMAEDLDAGAL